MSTYHHGDLRDALVASAAEILEEQGLAQLSLREAARRAGVSHNAPYRHFPDREALLAAVAAEGFSLLGKALEKSAGKEMGDAYVRFALEHPQIFRLMFGGLLTHEKYPELRAAAGQAYGALLDLFRRQMDEKQAAFAAAAAWSLVHGLSHLILDGHFAEAQRGGREAFVRRVLGAVRFAQRSE